MKPLYPLIPALLLAAFLAGCASNPDARIKKHQDAFNALSSADQGRIRGGVVNVGDSADLVLIALCDPDRRYSRTTASGTSEVWAYRDKAPAFSIGVGVGGGSGHTAGGVGVGVGTGGDQKDDKVRIVFEQGRVSAIERRGGR